MKLVFYAIHLCLASSAISSVRVCDTDSAVALAVLWAAVSAGWCSCWSWWLFSVRRRTSDVAYTMHSTCCLRLRSFTRSASRSAGLACQPRCRSSATNWRLSHTSCTLTVNVFVMKTQWFVD